MMINRLKGHFDAPGERLPENDYYVMAYRCALFFVTREVAEQILVALQSDTPPRWLRFTDVNGSILCVRTRLVEYIRECTVAQRAAQRAFRRARREEEKADRRPGEEDDD